MKVIGNLQVLGDKSILRFNPSPDNQLYSGFITDEYCSVDVTFGQALYYDVSTMRWKLAQANSSATMPCRGVALDTVSAGSLCRILRLGTINLSSWTFSSNSIYVSANTAGLLTTTQPSSSGNLIQVVGNAIATTIAYLDFNTLMVQIA